MACQQRLRDGVRFGCTAVVAILPLLLVHSEALAQLTIQPLSTALQAPRLPVKPPLPADMLLRRLVESGATLSPDLEDSIGREMASAVLAERALRNDVRLQTYVNQLGRWLSLESARPDLAWTFTVLDSPKVQTVAAPGGYVFVTQGLVNKLNTEAELAAVLAHQIAQVTEKIHLNRLSRKVTVNLNGSLATLSKEIYAEGPSDDEEVRADRLAVVLLARTGFNPKAMEEAIQLTSPNGTGKTFVSALIGPDAITRLRLTELKRYMGTRFDDYSSKRSPGIGQRLEQLDNAAGSTAQ